MATRTRSLIPMALTAVLAVGCVTLPHLGAPKDDRPRGDVCQIVTTWKNEVVQAADPVRNGQPTPGMAGRLYLFGQQVDFPRLADGTAVVDLFDESSLAKGGTAVHLEQWRLDAETLRRLERRDAIGWGYTLFLPWGTYKPDIRQVRLKVRFEPTKGAPLFTEGSAITLNALGTKATVAKNGPPTGGPAIPGTLTPTGFAAGER